MSTDKRVLFFRWFFDIQKEKLLHL